jgi:hypothetical protein
MDQDIGSYLFSQMQYARGLLSTLIDAESGWSHAIHNPDDPAFKRYYQFQNALYDAEDTFLAEPEKLEFIFRRQMSILEERSLNSPYAMRAIKDYFERRSMVPYTPFRDLERTWRRRQG